MQNQTIKEKVLKFSNLDIPSLFDKQKSPLYDEYEKICFLCFTGFKKFACRSEDFIEKDMKHQIRADKEEFCHE